MATLFCVYVIAVIVNLSYLTNVRYNKQKCVDCWLGFLLIFYCFLNRYACLYEYKPHITMMSLQEKVFLCLCISFTMFKTVYSINCYQCSGTDSNNPFQCNEFLENDVDLVPSDCATIHDAQYCIKHVGRYEGSPIECYQCNSSSTMECGDGLMALDGGILKPLSCDHVFNAQYCIKLTGGISTKRFCSSLDLGNYCNYVQQPGDKLEYRTCIYTCSTDGCNAGTSLKTPLLSVITAFIVKFIVL